MKVSVIIPCYNEEENVKECINRINLPYTHEIILVDDGSEDKTRKEAKEIKKSNLKVIGYKKNQGKGNAVRVGVEHTDSDIIAILDADMATPPEELIDILEPLITGKADFVNGSRLVYPMEEGAMRRLHVFGNKIFALVISLALRVWFTDTLCGLKAFNLKKFKNFELKEKSWPDFELLFKAKKHGLRIVEVPIHYKRRIHGKSKMRTFNHGYNMTSMLLKNFYHVYLKR